MDFELTEDQVALQDGIRTFLAGRFPLEVVRAGEETPDVVDHDRWRELGELGVFALAEQGFGMADAVLAFEELGRALVPGPLVATYLAAELIPAAASGEAVVGVVEPSEPRTMVEHPAALSTLLVLDDSGVRQIDLGALELRTVARPLDALAPVAIVEGSLPAGVTLAGPDVAARWRLHGATLTAALQLGVALASLDLATEYAKERHQFGRAIGSFQAIKHLLADVLVKAEVARAAVYAAAVALDGKSPDDPARAVAAAKLLAGDAAIFAAKTGIQVHGGMGFTWEVDAQRYWKRANVLETHFGTSDHHAEAFAAMAL